jgi:DNA mismatch repair protein MutL
LNRIERLPDDLVNKIAAGEVVERPASVVKELVENALDAGARSVVVEVEAGGKSLIRVRDDGAGMSGADAALSIERHATSKLRALDDLQSVETHGFRGEALPSIASVSHLLLRTRDESGPEGTEVEVRHGKLVHVRAAGHPRGTTVEVRDLFGGVPARRKFLRADATEASHVAEAVTLLALARPEVGFSLGSGGRRVLDAPAVQGLAERLYQILGQRALDDLVPVEGGEGFAVVRGFVSRPEASGGRGVLRLFVNRRPVRDRAVSKALLEAYRALGMRDPRPEAFLFIEAPPAMVDVNVHPAKSEVRFADGRTVWTAVDRSVRDALSAAARGPAHAPVARVEEAAERYVASHDTGDGAAAPTGAAISQSPRHEAPAAMAPLFAGAPPTVLGQHRNTYIVATDGEDIVLVDQHTARERVLFERIQARRAERGVESQMLLAPAVVALSPDLVPLLEGAATLLSALGFDAEPFGGSSVRLRAVPALLAGRDPGAALQSLLRDVLEREAADWVVAGRDDRLAATLACHASVRAGEALGADVMRGIVTDLFGAAHPGLCPHGRPTHVRIPRDDVARWFGRSGWRRQ